MQSADSVYKLTEDGLGAAAPNFPLGPLTQTGGFWLCRSMRTS